LNNRRKKPALAVAPLYREHKIWYNSGNFQKRLIWSKVLMNNELLKRAKEKVSSDSVLINLISKRVRELINGAKPLVRPKNLDEDKCDIALREVAEGKLIAQIDFDAIQRMDDAKKAWTDKKVNTNMYFAD